jgi:hypothetical protein
VGVCLEDHAHLNLKTCGQNPEGFVDMLKQWRDSYQFLGTPCFVFASKLNRLKNDLKCWNREVFSNVGESKKFLLEEIQSLDQLEEERYLVEEERVKRAKAKAYLENVVHMQEVSWRQKLRATCLKDWDHNTRFFFRLAKSHKR